MVASFPRLIVCAAVLTTLFGAATGASAQIPTGSSARSIPTEVEKTNGQVSQLIARAEDHFRKGKLNLDDNKRDAARDEFDKAVDTLLESGLDVRANQRLQTFTLSWLSAYIARKFRLGTVCRRLRRRLWLLRTASLQLHRQDKHRHQNLSRRRSRLAFVNRSSSHRHWTS